MWRIPMGRSTLFVILLVALALRLIGIQRDLWYDEAFSVFNARGADIVNTTIEPNGRVFTSDTFAADGGWRGLLVATSHSERTPPLYFCVLRLWTAAFGGSNAALRLLSVVFGVLTILCVYLLGRSIAGESVGLAAAAILAMLPSHIQYSQQVRAYSLAILLTSAASVVFWNAVKSPRDAGTWRQWTIYGALVTASLYTHYFTAGIFAAHAVFTMFLPARMRLAVLLRLVGAGAIALVCLTPWVFNGYLASQLGLMTFYERGSVWTLETVKDIARLSAALISGWFPAVPLLSLSGLLVAILLGAFAWCFRAATTDKPDRAGVVFALLLVVIPLAAIVAAALVMGQQLMLKVPHYLMPAVTGLAVVMAMAVTEPRLRGWSTVRATVSIFSAVSVWFQIMLVSPRTYELKPFYGSVSKAVATLNETVSPSSVIVFDHVSLAVTWNLYQRSPLPQVVLAPQAFFSQQVMDFDRAWQSLAARFDTVNLVRAFHTPPSETSTRLDASYQLVKTQRVGEWELRTYRRTR